jgi:hypothetical protein
MTYRCVTADFVCAAETDLHQRVRYGTGWFTAPILKRFANQPLGHLERWIHSLGGTMEELNEPQATPQPTLFPPG